MSDSITIRPQTQYKTTTYMVEWWVNGVRRRRTKKTKLDANNFKQELIDSANRAKALEELKAQGMVFNTPAASIQREEIQTSLTSFYKSKLDVVVDQKDMNSLKIEKINYNQFGVFIVDVRKKFFVDEIVLQDMEAFRGYLKNVRKVSNSTIVRKENSIVAYLNYCISHKYISDNPASGLRSLSVITPPRQTMRGTDYYQEMADGLVEWASELWECMGETMARNIELETSVIGDINFGTREIRLVSKKGCHIHERFVPLTERAVTILKKVVAMRKLEGHGELTDLVFRNSKGNPVTSNCFCDVVRETRRKLDIPEWVTAYINRHDGLKALRRANVHQSHIGEIGGHRKESTTRIYLANERQDLRNVINIFEAGKNKKAQVG